MNRKKKLALYLAVVVILSVYLFTWYELFFTWESAFRHRERNLHFGPATEIVHIEDEFGRLIFARDEDWLAPFYVDRVFRLFHRSNDSLGRPLKLFNWEDSEEDEAIVFRMRRFYQSEQVVTAFYAFAEEPIATIEIELRNGEVLTMNPFSEGVYYDSYYSDMTNLTDYVEEIRGYDEQGQLVSKIEG